jgi:hypothetical protein
MYVKVSNIDKIICVELLVHISDVPSGVFNPPSPRNFRIFDKAEPNSQFRG